MKKFLVLLLITGSLFSRASAQEKFNLNHFLKSVGKKMTLCDTVYSFKILSDTVTMLNMGAKYPNQTFTVVVTGKQIELNYDGIVGKHICVTGDASLYKGKPEIMIYHPDQIVFK
jgi:DNA/RNA endonuclease YhcR with UshA esterase domain